MKLLKKMVALTMVVCASLFLFTGCTYHKYELIGIVEEDGTVVKRLHEIADQDIIDYLYTSYQNKIFIDLNMDGSFSMGYEIVNNGLTVSYTQVGTFDIDHEKEIINFHTPKGNGEYRTTPQQYSNGMIIYFDGVVHLAFK